jgi:hypothetical protein
MQLSALLTYPLLPLFRKPKRLSAWLSGIFTSRAYGKCCPIRCGEDPGQLRASASASGKAGGGVVGKSTKLNLTQPPDGRAFQFAIFEFAGDGHLIVDAVLKFSSREIVAGRVADEDYPPLFGGGFDEG